ncbi:MAG: large conductance mechanosensitive channel protein MscL [Clostridia bacterium]|nr:large conductance mechanosensitive channel protein MscL [Clostridia bacterium]
MKKFITDFKEFVSKGNVMDMAVAVIIGAAFGKIVTSLVDDIIMPLITLITGGASVEEWKWVISAAEVAEDGTELVAENALRYGLFIQNIIDFLIVAFVIFLVLRAFMKMKDKMSKKPEEEEEVATETQEDVIKDMRRLLKKVAGEPEEDESAEE